MHILKKKNEDEKGERNCCVRVTPMDVQCEVQGYNNFFFGIVCLEFITCGFFILLQDVASFRTYDLAVGILFQVNWRM